MISKLLKELIRVKKAINEVSEEIKEISTHLPDIHIAGQLNNKISMLLQLYESHNSIIYYISLSVKNDDK